MLKPETQFKTIDEYLALVPAAERAALQKIRKTVQSAAPAAVETISYGMPAFRHHGLLVGFAAFKQHCSFFPMNGHCTKEFAEELSGYSTTKSAIRFPAERPLPAALIRRIVKHRMAENEAKGK